MQHLRFNTSHHLFFIKFMNLCVQALQRVYLIKFTHSHSFTSILPNTVRYEMIALISLSLDLRVAMMNPCQLYFTYSTRAGSSSLRSMYPILHWLPFIKFPSTPPSCLGYSLGHPSLHPPPKCNDHRYDYYVECM